MNRLRGASTFSLFAFAVLALLATPLSGAQAPAKVPTLGYIAQFSGPAGPKSRNMQAFLQGLSELGYVEGKNIAIEYRYTEGKNDRLPASRPSWSHSRWTSSLRRPGTLRYAHRRPPGPSRS